MVKIKDNKKVGILDYLTIDPRTTHFPNAARFFNRTLYNTQEIVTDIKAYINQKQNILNKVINGFPKTVLDAKLNIYYNINPDSGYANPIQRFIGAITNTKSDDMLSRSPVTDAAFATYLNIPNDKRIWHIELPKSKYRPTKGDTVGEVYSLPLMDNELDKGMIIKSADSVKIGESKQAEYLPMTGSNVLGNYTVSRGIDNKGEYISYYDTYDLNPFKGYFSQRDGVLSPKFLQNIEDLSLGLGTPFTLYDRIYLDDYYGVKESLPKDAYYGGYLPEIVITANRKYATGGPLKKSYKDFSTRLSKAWDNQDISKDDYDYQKYYNDNPTEAYRQLKAIEQGSKAHFPDAGKSGTYKKPSHPTYPDLGANSWLNNDKVFNMSTRQAVPNNTDRVLDYLGSDLDYNNGSTKAIYNGAYQLPSITVTPKGNYTELIPNELGTGWMYSDRAGRYQDLNYDYLRKYLNSLKINGK